MLFASSCQHFFIPISLSSELKFFWPNQWFHMIREGKSAIACIFGLVGWTEIILTSNHFIYQTPKNFLVCAQLCSACSVLLFWVVFGSCRVNEALTLLFYCFILFVWSWYIIQSWKKDIFSLRPYWKWTKCWISINHQKM